MRAVACAPGTAIVPGDTFRLRDLLLGFAVRIEQDRDFTIVIDHAGCPWLGVTVLRPGEFRLVEAVSGGVPYAAARPLQGHSQASELVGGGVTAPYWYAGLGGGYVNRVVREKARSGLQPKRAFSLHGERRISNQLMLATFKGSSTNTSLWQ